MLRQRAAAPSGQQHFVGPRRHGLSCGRALLAPRMPALRWCVCYVGGIREPPGAAPTCGAAAGSQRGSSSVVSAGQRLSL